MAYRPMPPPPKKKGGKPPPGDMMDDMMSDPAMRKCMKSGKSHVQCLRMMRQR